MAYSSNWHSTITTLNMCSDFVVVDRRGDLRLEVGREPGTRDDSWQRAEFLVCSRTLARASPVFDRMLHGPFVEAKHDPKDSAGWRVVLPDNNPAPMEVFLNIAHANVARIPHILSVDHLYDLAVLTNYYDATPLLSPWIDVWISSTSEISRDANMIQPKLLWISWEFGRTETFRIVAHRLLMEEPPRARSIHEGDEVQAPHILGKMHSKTPMKRKWLEVPPSANNGGYRIYRLDSDPSYSEATACSSRRHRQTHRGG